MGKRAVIMLFLALLLSLSACQVDVQVRPDPLPTPTDGQPTATPALPIVPLPPTMSPTIALGAYSSGTAVVPRQFHGTGTGTSVHQVALQPGPVRVRSLVTGLCILGVTLADGQDETVGETDNFVSGAESLVEMEIPTAGTYKLNVECLGDGDWTVTLEQ